MKLPRIMALFLTVLVLVMLAPALPAEGVQQAGLDSGGDAVEVNYDGQGNLYVSDATMGKIWQIRASDGSYTTYSLSNSVRDAQMGPNNRIWWVNGSDSFGYVLSGTPYGGTRWTLSSDPNYFIHSLVLDGQGGVWLGEYDTLFDDPGRLFHFNPSNKQLCQYQDLQFEINAYDMVYHSGYLWLSNWRTAQIFRILPNFANNSITYINWQEDYSGGALGVDFDGQYLWWADNYLGAIGRLDPDHDLATYYRPPDGVSPVMVDVNNGQVWYTEQFGHVGKLNPSSAAGDDVPLGWDSGSVQGVCATLGTPDYPQAQMSTGTLSWDDSPVSNIYDADGWKIYELLDASPVGVSVVGNQVWVSDSARDLLLRFETFSPFYYLPIIRKN